MGSAQARAVKQIDKLTSEIEEAEDDLRQKEKEAKVAFDRSVARQVLSPEVGRLRRECRELSQRIANYRGQVELLQNSGSIKAQIKTTKPTADIVASTHSEKDIRKIAKIQRKLETASFKIEEAKSAMERDEEEEDKELVEQFEEECKLRIQNMRTHRIPKPSVLIT
jgi:hypothetical protein